MDRRIFILGVPLLAMGVAPARADPAFKRLLPLLVDLPGFTGAKADGMTMEMGDGAMTTVGRKYTKGAASVDIAVVSGQAAVGALAPITSGMKIETTDGHMIPDTIDGFRAMRTYNNKEQSGALIVALAKDAVMTFGYRNLSEDDAVALARKLDWKALAAAK